MTIIYRCLHFRLNISLEKLLDLEFLGQRVWFFFKKLWTYIAPFSFGNCYSSTRSVRVWLFPSHLPTWEFLVFLIFTNLINEHSIIWILSRCEYYLSTIKVELFFSLCLLANVTPFVNKHFCSLLIFYWRFTCFHLYL